MQIPPTSADAEPDRFKQLLPALQRPQLLTDSRLFSTGVKTQSPGKKAGVRHEQQEQRPRLGHANHLTERRPGFQKMLQRPEAGDEIKFAVGKRKALRRATMKFGRRQGSLARVERHLGNVYSGGDGAKIGRGVQPGPASATNIEKPLAPPRLETPRQLAQMMGDLGLNSGIPVMNAIIVIADHSMLQALSFSHRFVCAISYHREPPRTRYLFRLSEPDTQPPRRGDGQSSAGGSRAAAQNKDQVQLFQGLTWGFSADSVWMRLGGANEFIRLLLQCDPIEMTAAPCAAMLSVRRSDPA